SFLDTELQYRNMLLSEICFREKPAQQQQRRVNKDSRVDEYSEL
ncbi:uncharacterized, partial [Tachysurus ichikawai]